MDMTRRDILSRVPGILAGGTGVSEMFAARTNKEEARALPSAVFPFEHLQVHKAKGGGSEIRSVLKGKLATGESIEVHETSLAPGGAPHPPHHHEHSEMWLIREGTVELTISGKVHQLGAGSVGFVRSNEEHGISNPSDKPASYFVVAVGPGADR